MPRMLLPRGRRPAVSALLSAVALVFATRPARAQEEAPSYQLPDLPELYFDLLCFAADEPGKSRLDVYVEVPYEALHFAREEEVFRTSYDVAVQVSDSLEKLVA